LVVNTQVEAAGVETGMAQICQPGEGEDVKQDETPGEKVRELKKLVGTEGKRPEFEPGGRFEGIYGIFGQLMRFHKVGVILAQSGDAANGDRIGQGILLKLEG
jgi:hypothetical protein